MLNVKSKQLMYCRACGAELRTCFSNWDGAVCDKNCFKELEWRRVLSIMGKEYYPDPKKDTYEDIPSFIGMNRIKTQVS